MNAGELDGESLLDMNNLAVGFRPEIYVDESYIYVKVELNRWQRAPWPLQVSATEVNVAKKEQ